MPSFNPFSSNATINTHRNSVRSDRPPTYTTVAPDYTPNEQGSSSAGDRSERVRAWSESLPPASSKASQDSDTVFGQPESSLSDTVSIEETSGEMTRPPGPRCIYYRTYAEDGAIPSKNPVFSDDPYLGRIPATHVTPPHTAINLKKCLSGSEAINKGFTTSLFLSASSQTPMDDNGRVSILAYPGPGCTPHEPMAFVAAFSSGPSEAASHPETNLPSQEATTPVELQYIYYRVYKEHGAVISKQPADSNDPYVGRIRVDSIPPPHTAASIKRCILKIEELDKIWQSQLFTSVSNESPISDGHVSILTSDRPGSTPEDPMAFVELPVTVDLTTLHTLFHKQIRVVASQGHYTQNPDDWLPITAGEILRTTNEEPRNQPYNWRGQVLYDPAHKAVNIAGKVGFVHAPSVQPC